MSYKQKMMIDSSNDVSLRIQSRVTSPQRKENAPIPLFLTASTPSFKPVHPHQQRVLQSNWLNITVKQPSQPTFTKILSPKSFYTNASVLSPKQARIIELGGSKQKRESRERKSSVSQAETQKNQLSASDTLSRRVAMLESRVKELHLEKQQLAIDLTQKNKILQNQNQRLNALVKALSTQKTTSLATFHEEFNLQEELSNQISINLELRQELQNMMRELEGSRQKCNSQREEFNSASQEYADLRLQFIQLQDSSQDKIQHLQAEIQALQASLQKEQAATVTMIQEREKRILQLQDQNFSLTNKVEQEQRKMEALNAQISSLNAELITQKHESQNLKGRLCELQKPAECKKCKELLLTVFRLNSQLNRK